MFFKKKKILSIDFGSHFLKFCLGYYDKNRLIIAKVFAEEIRPGAIENGKINDYEYIKNLIIDAIKKNSIKCKEVAISINSSDIIKRDIKVEIVDSKDQKSLIAFEIEKFIPNNIDNYHLQYKKMNDINLGDEIVEKSDFMVALMPKQMSDDYYNLVTDLKMIPQKLDIHCNSVNKLLDLKHLNLVDETYSSSNFLIIDIGFNNINTFIIENGFYKFDRRIHSGVKEIERALQEYDGQIINQEGFLKEFNSEVDSLKEDLDYWIIETSKIIRFYENSNNSSKIDHIYLYGGGTSINFIDMFFQKNLKIKTDIIDVESFVEFEYDCELDLISAYLNTIGALISDL